MYIISKFKDYYDGAVGMGIDKTIVYERAEKEIQFEEVKKTKLIEKLNHKSSHLYYIPSYKLNFPNFHVSKHSKYDHVTTFIVAFCGKYYLGFEFTGKIRDKWGHDTHEEETEIIYDVSQVKQELSFENMYSWDNSKNASKRELIKFNNFLDKVNNFDDTEIFFKYRTPIFIIKPSKTPIELNPTLKDYKFYKVIDTYTAFQEIQMFISGVLGTNEDGHDTPMSEKQKVQQHGFDQKYGFRTRPKG